MANDWRDRGSSDIAPGASRLCELPAPSSLLSSRWSRDNLVTSHPARLYDGRIRERIDADALERLVSDFQAKNRVELGAGRMGVFTWDVVCEGGDGPLVLQVPLVLDEVGKRGRARCLVPRRNVENLRGFLSRGLTRFVVEPRGLARLAGDVPAALFSALPEHRALTFALGALQVEVEAGEQSFGIQLGRKATSELLAEIVAALVYHYEPERDGGTAITDVAVNDGDFVVKRRSDGSFELRLTAARSLDPGVGPSLLLLYLVQLLAYQDFEVCDELFGLPMPISNPSIAFHGLVRGLRYRARDLGGSEDAALEQGRAWIRDFGWSREGRAYRPWVERFLDERLPLEFGDDLREHWWRLTPAQTRLGALEIVGRVLPEVAEHELARELRALLDGLSRELGCSLEADPTKLPINELDEREFASLLERANLPRALLGRLFAAWPYRDFSELSARVPEARGLSRFESQLSFGRVVSSVDEGTLRSLGPKSQSRPSRAIANCELFGGSVLPPGLEQSALAAFPSFEAYMEAVLHDPDYGYYARRVSIGLAGHFETHPEVYSPHYGGWLAELAFRADAEMRARGELSADARFQVVELGAGNGRLARDFVDTVRAKPDTAPRHRREWKHFADRLEYRIYERSESLRQRQRELLGDRATVAGGDARHPGRALARDFPGGVKGLVLTNEVPDAFGVHKLVLGADARALAALVVPRVEARLLEHLEASLARQIGERDAALRLEFPLSDRAGELYLDAQTLSLVLRALARHESSAQDELLARLWFEEAYVPAACIPELSAHLASNAADYATALAAEDSGVVLYVNLHAERFIAELGACLGAGHVVTIDYGDTSFGLVQGARSGEFPFRVYGEWHDYQPRPNDPYAAPGTQDLTADVNFTALARAGARSGLSVQHFGPERDAIGAGLLDLVSGRGHERVREFLGNPVFKVLVQGKRPTALFDSPFVTPLALFASEAAVPKQRRARIPELKRALEALAGSAQPL
ncbi:MAG: SAM-dependent methyltransferase [Myxococcota bacterium]|nr:SAM-dependent methyltransferase [Myxococcota bacterium]